MRGLIAAAALVGAFGAPVIAPGPRYRRKRSVSPATTREEVQEANRRRELLRLAAVSRKRLAGLRSAYRAANGGSLDGIEDEGAISYRVTSASAEELDIARGFLSEKDQPWYPCPECLEALAGVSRTVHTHTSPMCRARP